MTEHLERLRAMVAPGQRTWDLSPNDVAAIRWAVEQIQEPEDGEEEPDAGWMKRAGFLNEDPSDPDKYTLDDSTGNVALTVYLRTEAPHAALIGDEENGDPWPHDIYTREQLRDIARALGTTLTEAR